MYQVPIQLFAAVLLSLSAAAYALPERVPALPPGTAELRVNGTTYHHRTGDFYLASRNGYLRVEPPPGARVYELPAGSEILIIGGRQYFLTPRGTYYLRDPRGDHFTVVEPPSAYALEELSPPRAPAYPREPYYPRAPYYPSQPIHPAPPAYPRFPQYGYYRDWRTIDCGEVATERARVPRRGGRGYVHDRKIYNEVLDRCLRETR